MTRTSPARRILRRCAAQAAAAALAVAPMLCFSAGAAAREEVNLASPDTGVKVYVSSAPNPAWPAAQVNDGALDTTHGWVASADQGTPWVTFEFEAPRRVSSVTLYQAGLTEGAKGRFARPRQIRITTDGAPPVTAELQDAEREPQKVRFSPADTTFVKIDILSTWPDAKFPFLTGFQEVEIYSGDIISINGDPAPSGTDAPPMLPDDDAPVAVKAPRPVEGTGAADISATADAVEAAVGKTLGRDGLDDEERALVALLREFTAKLEEYLKRKNNGQK